ncbi:MAG TPA: hypothetical protein VMY76_00560 [Gemmatimonadales bacterium]|nr:hypothetical protein [Gemmatimonadales bacterium]
MSNRTAQKTYRLDVQGGHWYKFEAASDAEAAEKAKAKAGPAHGGKVYRYEATAVGGEVLVKSFSHQPSLAAATGR